MGATVSSEMTAAAVGGMGQLRRDPFAMLPFCGYNMADYWGHWIEMGKKFSGVPRIFQVNWFRKNSEGTFIWPGFGENSRVLAWIIGRLEGSMGAEESALGFLPITGDLDLDGLGITPADQEELFAVQPDSWLDECAMTDEYFNQFAGAVPAEVVAELSALKSRLMAVAN